MTTRSDVDAAVDKLMLDMTDAEQRSGGFMSNMTLRQYYKAHAPPAPEWFEPAMPDRPSDVETTVWSLKYMVERILQWPAHFADAMLAEDSEFAARK